MARVSSFISLSIDACYADTYSTMTWAHSNDEEQTEFTNRNAEGGGRLMLGRITYDMMADFWPTPAAQQMLPRVAERMNALPKIVFSRTMEEAEWSNTTLIQGDLVAETKKLKADGGPDITILGSGNIVSQLADAGLLDELQVMLVPISLGAGKRLFGGGKWLGWKREEVRPFKNGNVFIRYRPA